MPHRDTLDHLSRIYAQSEDPWDHRTSAYEAGKYEATLRHAGPGPFACALEIGCGIGELSRRLAPRCASLLAMDVIPEAVARARATLAACPQARVVLGAAPRDLPEAPFDLVLLSEVLYFLTPDEIADLGAWLARNATGPIVAVNWTGPTDEPLTGEAAAALLAQTLPLSGSHVHEGFRIDTFLPRSP